MIPADELVERFSRSSGPGGQSVNTTDSRVELVFDAGRRRSLTAASGAGLGTIRVVASEHRSQHRNRGAARERLATAIRTALAPPPAPRVPTKPSKSSRRRRVEAKRSAADQGLQGRVRGE